MATCEKCLDTGWRLLPSIDPTHAVECDRCEAPKILDVDKVAATHGLLVDDPAAHNGER